MKPCNLSTSILLGKKSKKGILYVTPNEIGLGGFSKKYVRKNSPLAALLVCSPVSCQG